MLKNKDSLNLKFLQIQNKGTKKAVKLKYLQTLNKRTKKVATGKRQNIWAFEILFLPQKLKYLF